MGGRAAEQLAFGKISTGALSDLEKVTKQAYAMVAYFGMSEEIGNISFYDSTGQTDFNFTKPYSEKTAELIDKEVKKIVEEAYQRAAEVLEKNRKGLVELAELLLEKEVIFGEDLEKIFGKRKSEVAKPPMTPVTDDQKKEKEKIVETVTESTNPGKNNKTRKTKKDRNADNFSEGRKKKNNQADNNGERVG